MAKYLDNDGLLYLWQKIKSVFATKDALDDKVDKVTGKGLSTNDYTTADKDKLNNVANGAQVNVIETVKVNSTALTPSSKAVNITVPTKTSDITNDSGFITSADIPEGAAASTTTPKMDGTAAVGTETAFARGDHVHPSDTSRVPTTRKVAGHALSADVTLAKGDVGLGNVDNTADADKPVSTAQQTALDGKLDKSDEYGLIGCTSVTNGYTFAIRTGNTVGTFNVVSLNAFYTNMQQAMTVVNGKADASDLENYALKSDITNMYKYKGSVATVSALPSSDNTIGDVYNVEATGMNYAWNGTAWDALGEIFTITSISNSDIDTIVAS